MKNIPYLLLLYFLLNCASSGYNYKYSKSLSNIANPNETQFRVLPGSPLYPTKDLALLTLDPYIVLLSLDDEESFPYGFEFVVLKPGNHKARIRFSSPNFRSNSAVTVNFISKPNQTIFFYVLNRQELAGTQKQRALMVFFQKQNLHLHAIDSCNET
ncbi:MAG TPA: hypothetical protein PK079_18285 [Leptospiraceae bacterium]|nr:hypothetical protein [Leptospiraceae bacterium]HMW08023.1 hypothetical protein [Leptospiraceae bacterium]HMX34706.1 hypothetical protein [Leptospiraceae bacterium]HMY33757.1 hypothetical protein [Leptospiraceae bacterium]HMZ64871.1 hypothetical protein [Leptospiraceae bacterium]